MKKLSLRTLYFMGFILTASLLCITFYLENFDGFVPCPLCILQRIILVLLGIVFLMGMLFAVKRLGNMLLSLLASVFALIGIFLSGRQVWLQHMPPDKNADCGANLQYLIHVLPFDQVLAKILHGTAECAQKGWEFLQLSLAEWSLICFIGFFILSLFLIIRSE